MNEAERRKRDREIVSLFRAGNRPAQIGDLYGIEATRVRRILRVAGIDIDRLDGYDKPNLFWDQSERRLREAIWERQRTGARQTLKAFSPTINSAHTHPTEYSTKPA